MDPGDNIKYWLELSEYDLETAKAMLASKRYLYVGFMAHQVVEKTLKALFVAKNGDSAPYSHSLALIAKKAAVYDELSETQKDFIDMLEPLNIEARYPTYKEQLLKSLTHGRCIEIIENTEELRSWLVRKL